MKLGVCFNVSLCHLALYKTLMILLLPLFIVLAAEHAWLLLCLMQKMNLLDTILTKKRKISTKMLPKLFTGTELAGVIWILETGHL